MILESRYGADGVRDLDLFIAKARISLVPVDEEQADLARQAFRKFGKGRHPAGLNFGDCFSYALARSLDEPLLFKGNDFSQTDIECHPASG
jgi:ribonuclease VapC